MFNWLTFRPSGRRASSYRLVTTRFSRRRRTATQSRAMMSMLLVGLSMVVLPRVGHAHCICKYRQGSSPPFGKAQVSAEVAGAGGHAAGGGRETIERQNGG